MQSSDGATNRTAWGFVPPHVLFFLSGVAALAYEASWSRLVGLVLGNTAEAAALVLAGYFAGLAAGQLLGGFLAERVRPFIGYGLAELLPPAWAALVPTLLPLVGTADGTIRDAPPALRAAWCFAVLLPATAALGSTLPFMAAYVTSRGGSGRQVALAYGLNTAGGLVGLVAATAFLLVTVGVRTTGYSAAGVSAVCGVAACVLVGSRRSLPAVSTKPNDAIEGTRRLCYFVAAVSGFGTLGLEVLYTRLFALVFHNSSYTFGAVVAVFLAGLSVGALLASALGLRVSRRSSVAVIATLGGVAVAASVVLFLRLTGLRYFSEGDTFGDYLTHSLGLTTAVVLPPATLLGVLLPTVLSAAGGSGKVVGRITAVNTAAAVAGALAAGFLFPQWVGIWESFGLFALVFGLTGAGLLYARGRVVVATGAGVITAVSVTVAASGQAFVQQPPGEELLRRWNSAYGWIDVVRNSKTDALSVRQNLHYRHGSTGSSAAREYRQGRLPLLLHPNPGDVAFLGLGTGLTAASVVSDRDVKRAVVVELIPEVVEASRLLTASNLGVVDNPKVEVRVDDARHYLGHTERTFEVVVSDLFVPWESRAGYLYTVEFYETVRKRLKPGGLFCQWLALYQVGPADFELIADSFAVAFPTVSLWWGQLDPQFPIVALVGTTGPLELDRDRLSARAAAQGESPLGMDFDLVDWSDLTHRFIGCWPARPGVVLNTDEHPRLEFQAPVSQRSGLALHGPALHDYFERVLGELPPDGVQVRGWQPAGWSPAARRVRQGLSLRGGGRAR